MTNNMDELLNQLAAEYIQKKEAQAKSKTPPPAKRSSKKSTSSASMDEILSDLKVELESHPSRSQTVSPSRSQSSASRNARSDTGDRDRLIAEIEREYQKSARYREEKLAAIQRQKEALLAEQKRREQELLAAQKLQEQKEQRRKAALREKAQQWLKTLNPRSEEGKWFEEFSYSYDSKLAAAIDYLEAMRESGL